MKKDYKNQLFICVLKNFFHLTKTPQCHCHVNELPAVLHCLKSYGRLTFFSIVGPLTIHPFASNAEQMFKHRTFFTRKIRCTIDSTIERVGPSHRTKKVSQEKFL